MQTLISVPTGTFIAVPNGAFSLKDVLVAPTTKQIIETLRNETRANGRKLRIFLSFYQTFDMVAQLQEQGVAPETVDIEEISTVASLVIEQGFDTIMETFTEAERAFLNSLFKEGEVSHV